MRRIGGERNQNEKNDRGVGGVKLGGEQNDKRLQKIKPGRDRRAAPLKNCVGDVAGEERAGRGDERDEKSDELKLGRLKIDGEADDPGLAAGSV